MRALAVLIADPIRNLGAGVVEAEEQGFVEKLISHPAVEAFKEAVLHRFARRDEVPSDLVVLQPGQHVVPRHDFFDLGDRQREPGSGMASSARRFRK